MDYQLKEHPETELEHLMNMDAEAVTVPTDYELGDIAGLADQQLALEKEIAELEAKLAGLGVKLRKIAEDALPTAMSAVNLSEFRLENGMRITIKKDVFASIRADFKAKAFKWLKEHDLGDIVKDEIQVTLGKGKEEVAKEILVFVKDLGIPAAQTSIVHAGTLKATVKEMRAKGVEFPEEYFSIGDLTKAIIKAK